VANVERVQFPIFTTEMPKDGFVPVQVDSGLQKTYPPMVRGVRREVAEAAYKNYARRYGMSQSFDRLHERGGFSIGELLAHLTEEVG